MGTRVRELRAPDQRVGRPLDTSLTWEGDARGDGDRPAGPRAGASGGGSVRCPGDGPSSVASRTGVRRGIPRLASKGDARGDVGCARSDRGRGPEGPVSTRSVPARRGRGMGGGAG
jgi:hypothetical protein